MPFRVSSPRAPFRIVVGTAPFVSLLATGRGMALVLLETGAVCLFAAGIAARTAGPAAPLYLLAAVLIGWAFRAVDLEHGALFIPGGLYGAFRQAFGSSASVAAASVAILHRLVHGALAAAAAGYSVVAIGELLGVLPSESRLSVDDLATTIAVCFVGAIWIAHRQARRLTAPVLRRTTFVVSIVAAAVVAAVVVVVGVRHGLDRALLEMRSQPFSLPAALAALGACLFVSGATDGLSRMSAEFDQPKVRNLRKAASVANVLSLVLAVGSCMLFVAVVPAEHQADWADAPLPAILWFAAMPRLLGLALAAAVAAAIALFLFRALYTNATSAQRLLLRFSEDGLLPRAIRAQHSRFGTPSRLSGIVAVGQLTLLLATSGHFEGLARVLAMVVAIAAVVHVAALVRLRALRPEPRAFRIGLNVRLRGREWPAGLVFIALVAAVAAGAFAGSGDAAALAAVALVVAGAVTFALSARMVRRLGVEESPIVEDVDLVAAPAVGLEDVHVRPGNVIVPIRRPGALAHLAAALQSPGDRDVVAMTVRLVGVDASDEFISTPRPTDAEHRLLSDAAMLAERMGRALHLLIVPASNVFDAVAATVARLSSSEIYVGESETLSAADQARLLGEAWERIPPPKPFDVRLVVRHSSGGTAVYQLGAHAPSLAPDDLRLIHELWLDLSKSVGPHVHHHDVVRAALMHMQEQLNDEGSGRAAAIDLVRRIARPADELAAAVHQRDFVRLRDMVRNRPSTDLAAVLTELAPEDQVVAFRVLPRKVAAATFEYLTHEAQQTLLRAMAKEDIAAILNDMAPDDRTMFLEELPASATQQLLTLLTPEERAVAVTLLGYPEDSIGRLMTPDYIAVRESWTVQEVLDYIRAHGQDSETLNVIYVVDEHGVLIDDVRIREFLLTSPAYRVTDLMDRRFVALNAADDQATAVTVFRREDRSALPVTDSAGVLIGIVTIDDVLDVAEATATKEIQRIGGSEALDEPYMRIAFSRMIQKRAGWLTALFLGEMLTATAMGAFEREIERAVVLALFVPLIISSGGNSGSQASTLVIRAIALGEVQLTDWWRVMRREVAAGLALGSILGSIGVLRISIWSAFSDIYGPHWVLVAMTVGLALVGVVLWGTLIGSLLPFVLRRLGFDPAASSAPFVATLVDVTGLIIYFSVGLVVLRGTLL